MIVLKTVRYLMKCDIIKFNSLLSSPHVILFLIVVLCASMLGVNAQEMPRALIITGNGNVPNHKREYPPWVHEFQNDIVVEILKGTVKVDVTEDLSALQSDRLAKYDLVISNSLFLTPTQEQLHAL